MDDLSFVVEQGAFFGFLGPNGAGKTTTIRILTGVLKADQRDVLIAILPLHERNQIARIIGAIPESRGLYEWMTASEYLQFFANLYGIAHAERRTITESLLSQVDLAARKHTPIASYSRGMKQRLALARSLINHPQVLFLDEPTLGLDPQGQEEIQNLLRHLNTQGVTIFLSSHLLHEVSNLCTRIAIIHQGKLVAEGSLDSLRRDANFRESYLIRIAGDSNALQDLQSADRITTKKINGNATEIIFRGSTDEANQFLDSLRARRVSILEFRAETAHLTDIFLNLTGR